MADGTESTTRKKLKFVTSFGVNEKPMRLYGPA